MSDQVMHEHEFPTHCDVCGATLETGMVGVTDADVGNEPVLPPTTVVESFCPNPECSAHKPEGPAAG